MYEARCAPMRKIVAVKNKKCSFYTFVFILKIGYTLMGGSVHEKHCL